MIARNDERSRRAHVGVGALALSLAAGCASTTPTPLGDPDAARLAGGRRILVEQCDVCHALAEVTKFQGFYNAAQWRNVVLTMIGYGVAMSEADMNRLVEYLVEVDHELDD